MPNQMKSQFRFGKAVCVGVWVLEEGEKGKLTAYIIFSQEWGETNLRFSNQFLFQLHVCAI